MSETQTCYIEFRVSDTTRFQVMARFLEYLRTWSRQRFNLITQNDDTQETRSVTPMTGDETINKKSFDSIESWMLVLRPTDLDLLKMPAHLEAINAIRSWRGLSRRERRAIINDDESLQVLADFTDTLKQFDNTEYEIIGVRMISPDRARLEYAIPHYPYNGKSALESLLMFFGFFSILDSNG